ncbi:P-loop containing nucleoside triphosphate hydrolases superfamily protein [Arabidopsis thaliana]|uniref:P-loop containing nucleoside triphosphate hydrolases superfamily protein n=1 Tax=Arabidopsis thaliana TaxID=3702 RepID=A0A1P8AVE6_ARATH|nr:P-loop containing nucleoside triphosphate hydrolases superfamily protein [Arabidopsis thaliana]NP_001322885.1 P-loop containing nucleoside triphosphate hydrolases superfamily protein [Arabidopsis thaliana]ANM60609.1 P-loop containing nucleoside triphosphate hydrolases superfamily protein [Arabidopsis thaliana]ANM60610.1 P-loop containing nucleoside triphosphate hydrolases superfamily protein [Arabidopsis thaliana]|eukprot:NP_001322884.1 P-loop containing nucleoside triphosphate hydrolases superfamily protein [Arabidopsis thaliana]
MMNSLTDQSGSSHGGSTPRSPFSPSSPRERHNKGLADSRFQRPLPNSSALDPSSPGSMLHGGHKSHEAFQMKQGRFDLQAAKISELMKSNNLDNAPTQSLLSIVNGILDETIERKNGELPQRVACLLRKVVQEIERRISTQSEHLRTQNSVFKAREEKYQSRIKVLETLASGTSEENEIATRQLRRIKTEKSKLEEKKKDKEEDMVGIEKENGHYNLEISTLRRELETTKKAYEQQCLQMESKTKGATAGIEDRVKELEQMRKDASVARKALEERVRELEKMGKEADAVKMNLEEKVKELQKYKDETITVTTSIEGKNRELEQFKQETMTVTTSLEAQNRELEQAIKETMTVNTSLEAKNRELEQSKKETMTVNTSLKAKNRELEQNLVHWKSKAKEMEEKSELKNRSWSQKELSYRSFISFQCQALQELRFYSKSIKQEILKVQDKYTVEFSQLGRKLLELGDAAANYHEVLTENQKLFNELQELKGNIRVYCRVRPFLRGQGASKTVVEHIGDHGELVVLNPTKPGKDAHRKFRFNKVYSPASTQAEVFSDIKPLIRSVLDGYNVCIFAYGQTGSGKTYTMTGPDGASEEEWGVNYRALNDLFRISQSRKSNIAYEVGVQMVEIYNEQVRDLLSGDSSQKKLGILSTTQQNGLAVPDASMYPVTSTSDVLELMSIGLQNRVVSSTALNERSSRSHSIVTVHVRGKDLKTGSALYGNLHLVDLAGSERVDRSEVTGDRLKEAQHINKSLSALGDVIFSLASKSSHVPYRNSKLTQLLQSSLGGRAKTLMFVQLNPDITSYSESMSTLKFAERVSGVELGAAKSSKDGRDVRELMEQLGSLKDTIARKDDEIERLHLLKDINYPQRLQKKSLGQSDDFNSEAGDSQLSIEDDSRFQHDYTRQSRHSVTDGEALASSTDAEYDDETEGSTDAPCAAEGRKPLKISDKPKPVTPRSNTTTSRPLDKLKQVTMRTTNIAKATSALLSPSSQGMKKTGSASNFLKSPKDSKRWS